ncbi:NAD(P)-binding domain-containing protein [Streptomyces sp. JB150]|uniref:NAD(P)-binding domain-containing protein n=1 Tax=Streptomyces sp. JB150 TaxID=2714844 RepID=UPI00140B3A87|nr:NAD(P)-binding domain-containing protein [Streptomyces sp. JB150]QIJ63535.1 NAD(P)-binding domain-containing protein [Streptomyces sp. JB150]
MRVGVIGAGDMGRAMARRAAVAGAVVLLADRRIGRARAVAREAAAGTPGAVVACTAHVSFQPDLVILAAPRDESAQALRTRAGTLAGKVLVEVTAPHERTAGRRMRDLVDVAPEARWVRACPAGDAESIYRGELDQQPVDVFVASDDETAKVLMVELVNRAKLRALDAGGLDRARLLDEMVRLGREISHQLAAPEGWGLKFLPSW